MDAPPILQLVTHCWPTIDTSDRYGTYVLLPPIDSRKPLHLPPTTTVMVLVSAPGLPTFAGKTGECARGERGVHFQIAANSILAQQSIHHSEHTTVFKGLTLLWYNNGSFTFRFLAPLARFSTPQPKSNDVPRMTNSLHSLKLSQSRTCACCG